MSYGIDDQHGNSITMGISNPERARAMAQREADQRGEVVSLYEDGESGYEVIRPTRRHGDRKRVRRCIELTLSPEALAELTRRAGPGGSRSAAVEAWLAERPATDERAR